MSRYDGLIIPRSYSEYINKTDAATLQQALQLSGVLSKTVASGDSKAVTSNAVNGALAYYHHTYTSIDELITSKGISIALNNGEDNTNKIVSALDKGEVFNDYFNNYTSNSKWGLGSSSSTSYLLIRFEKMDNEYCHIYATETDTNKQYYRECKNGTLQDWQQITTNSDLANFGKILKYTNTNTVTLDPTKNYLFIYSNLAFNTSMLHFGFICGAGTYCQIGTNIFKLDDSVAVTVQNTTLTMPSTYTLYNCLTLIELPNVY